MIHMPEYSLYEAEDLFLKPIGIPDDFGFPVREDLIPKLETQISRIGKKLIREQWDELLLKRRVYSCTDDPGDQQGLYPAKCRPFY